MIGIMDRIEIFVWVNRYATSGELLQFRRYA